MLAVAVPADPNEQLHVVQALATQTHLTKDEAVRIQLFEQLHAGVEALKAGWPDNTWAVYQGYLLRADAASRLNLFANALLDVELAAPLAQQLRLEPEALMWKATVLERSGDMAGAKAAFEEAEGHEAFNTIDPVLRQIILEKFAWFLADRNRHEEASRRLRRAINFATTPTAQIICAIKTVDMSLKGTDRRHAQQDIETLESLLKKHSQSVPRESILRFEESLQIFRMRLEKPEPK